MMAAIIGAVFFFFLLKLLFDMTLTEEELYKEWDEETYDNK